MKKKILFIFFVFFSIAAFAKSAKSLDEVIEDAADKFIAKAQKGTIVFLGEFKAEKATSKKSAEFEKYVMGLLQQCLIDSDTVEVVERAQNEILEMERNYQQSGKVRDEDWAEIGAEYGAQYAIYGSGEWKSSTYVITLKMTNVETAKIVVSFRGEVNGKDKELRRMLVQDTTTPKKANINQKFTFTLAGVFQTGFGGSGSHKNDMIDKIALVNTNDTETISWNSDERAYHSISGAFFLNYRLKYGFGLESGASLYNGGGEFIIRRNGNKFYAEKYKIKAVDVPLCLSFQFKLFRTSIKLAGGMNFSIPFGGTYVCRGNGNGYKQDLENENAVMPGFTFGADYIIPVFKRAGLDFAVRYIKDINPYVTNYNGDNRELFHRENLNMSVGLYYKL